MNESDKLRFNGKSVISGIKNDLYGTGGSGDSASLNIHFFDEKKSFIFVNNNFFNKLGWSQSR